jgi:hypothetical protein
MTALHKAAIEWFYARSAYLGAARPTQDQQIRLTTAEGRLADIVKAIELRMETANASR